MKLLLQSLAFILNRLPKSRFKPIPLCNVYGRYGLDAPNLVGHVNAPTVTTDATPSSITTSSAVYDTNEITATGGENASVRGICYVSGAGGTPTTANTVVSTSGSYSTGTYSSTMSGLASGTTYSVRAFATNSAGTGYGSTVEVTTLANLAPTVALNSPADASSDSDTTPTLAFTGTDNESDDIRYELQHISGDNVLVIKGNQTPASGAAITQVELLVSNQPSSFGSHIITAPSGGWTWDKLNRLIIAINFESAVDSGFGPWSYHYDMHFILDGEIIYTKNANENGDVNTTEISFALLRLEVNNDSGLRYAVDGSDWVWQIGDVWTDIDNLLGDTVDTTAALLSVNSSGSLVGSLTSYKDKLSGTDSGFSGSPDNTDPFTSGQQVSYTVQSALDPDTYYWRVRGIDPSGSNTYGAWSSTRSFEVTGGATPNSGFFTLMRF